MVLPVNKEIIQFLNLIIKYLNINNLYCYLISDSWGKQGQFESFVVRPKGRLWLLHDQREVKKGSFFSSSSSSSSALETSVERKFSSFLNQRSNFPQQYIASIRLIPRIYQKKRLIPRPPPSVGAFPWFSCPSKKAKSAIQHLPWSSRSAEEDLFCFVSILRFQVRQIHCSFVLLLLLWFKCSSLLKEILRILQLNWDYGISFCRFWNNLSSLRYTLRASSL